MIEKFLSKKDAKEVANKMIGWKTKVIPIKNKDEIYFIIQCNKNKYLKTDGFIN